MSINEQRIIFLLGLFCFSPVITPIEWSNALSQSISGVGCYTRNDAAILSMLLTFGTMFAWAMLAIVWTLFIDPLFKFFKKIASHKSRP